VVGRFRGGRAVGCIAYSVSKSVVVYGYGNHEHLQFSTAKSWASLNLRVVFVSKLLLN
jgi:hypothetical protein